MYLQTIKCSSWISRKHTICITPGSVSVVTWKWIPSCWWNSVSTSVDKLWESEAECWRPIRPDRPLPPTCNFWRWPPPVSLSVCLSVYLSIYLSLSPPVFPHAGMQSACKDIYSSSAEHFVTLPDRETCKIFKSNHHYHHIIIIKLSEAIYELTFVSFVSWCNVLNF